MCGPAVGGPWDWCGHICLRRGTKKPRRLMSRNIFPKSPFSRDMGWRRGQNKKEKEEEKANSSYVTWADSTKTNRVHKRTTVIRKWQVTQVYFPADNLICRAIRLASLTNGFTENVCVIDSAIPYPHPPTKIENSQFTFPVYSF